MIPVGVRQHDRVDVPGREIALRQSLEQCIAAADVTDVDFIRPCNLCPHMKRITLPKIYESLESLEPRVEIDPRIAEKARHAVERMLEHG